MSSKGGYANQIDPPKKKHFADGAKVKFNRI